MHGVRTGQGKPLLPISSLPPNSGNQHLTDFFLIFPFLKTGLNHLTLLSTAPYSYNRDQSVTMSTFKNDHRKLLGYDFGGVLHHFSSAGPDLVAGSRMALFLHLWNCLSGLCVIA